jgi:hypothetical protein
MSYKVLSVVHRFTDELGVVLDVVHLAILALSGPNLRFEQ